MPRPLNVVGLNVVGLNVVGLNVVGLNVIGGRTTYMMEGPSTPTLSVKSCLHFLQHPSVQGL